MTYGEVCWSETCKTVDKKNHICLWEGIWWCFKTANRKNKSKDEINKIKGKCDINER